MQEKVDAICSDIRAMDLAKRHLTQSISVLENFGSLTDALAALKETGADRCAARCPMSCSQAPALAFASCACGEWCSNGHFIAAVVAAQRRVPTAM